MTIHCSPRQEHSTGVSQILGMGQIIVGNEHGYFIKGKWSWDLSQPDTMESFIDEDDLVILGNRAEDQLCAIEANASCLIVCLGAKVEKRSRNLQRREIR